MRNCCLILLVACTGSISEQAPEILVPVPEPIACEGEAPGARVQLARLTRAQYDAAILELTGLDLRLAERFPVDEASAGFEVARSISEVHVEGHLGAAASVAEAVDLGALLPCEPAVGRSCAQSFIDSFSRRAFRRPASSDERARLEAVFDVGIAPEGADDPVAFERGIRLVVEAALASPAFLYHDTAIAPDTAAAPGASVPLDGYAFASRLAFALWNTIPDDALLDAAPSLLTDDAALRAQADRMMQDGRFETGVAEFARQWLKLDAIENLQKDPAAFPEADADLAADLRRSLAAQVLYAFREDRSFAELLEAPELLATERMAAVYNLTLGERFDETLFFATPPAGERAGLLTHPALMALLATPTEGDPIHRGLFVLERLFCRELPIPDMDDIVVPAFMPGQSTRERFAAHTERAECRACHDLIDPLGFGFEAYDGLGRFRAMDQGAPVDASGAFPSALGEGRFDNASELVGLLADSENVRACFARQWWRFAHRREDSAEDACAIDGIRQGLGEGVRLRDLITGVVLSPDFRNAIVPGEER